VTKNSFSQNLVTNGSFENYTGSCPTGSPNGAFSQVTGGWSPANVDANWGVPHAELYCNGTPNYGNCLPGPVPNVGSDGVAYVGFHTRILAPQYNESIYQILAAPLIAGNTYHISFDLMDCQSGLFTAGPSDFCVYTNVDTIVPACPSDSPSVTLVGCVPYDSISNVAWKNHSFSFVAPPNSNILAFSGAACYVSEVYYYLDNIILTNTTSIQQVSPDNNNALIQNPFSESTIYKFKYSEKNKYTFLITNCNGKLVRNYDNARLSEIEIKRNGLAGGMYFFMLIENNEIIDRGKLLVR
jgi:hypothetical protein